ncbi:hypothetical protein CSQ88_22115 [Iodobacter sp. BJB302]|nr:hypothetical protein CSQ88_22115 [Iodobacter sp. BJB302]
MQYFVHRMAMLLGLFFLQALICSGNDFNQFKILFCFIFYYLNSKCVLIEIKGLAYYCVFIAR